jgi:uncharacterized protein (DUF302 family)
MTLPIDPAAVNPEDIGEEQVVLGLSHEQAVEVVREACEAAGFGIPVEFSMSGLLNEKIGAERDPYYVLGACNPEVADRALDGSNQRIGALAPCNVVVWQESPGRQRVYHVSIMRIARLVGMAPDDETWDAIVADTGEYVGDLFSRLRGSEHAVE